MKKLFLSVVTLCVVFNLVWAIDVRQLCSGERSDLANCMKQFSEGYDYCKIRDNVYYGKAGLERLRLKYEACLLEFQGF